MLKLDGRFGQSIFAVIVCFQPLIIASFFRLHACMHGMYALFTYTLVSQVSKLQLDTRSVLHGRYCPSICRQRRILDDLAVRFSIVIFAPTALGSRSMESS